MINIHNSQILNLQEEISTDYPDFEHITFQVPFINSQEERQKLRDAYHPNIWEAFYKNLAEIEEDTLREMGLDDFSLMQLSTYGRNGLNRKDKEVLDEYNVDHILSTKWRGTNDLRNLCLVPKGFNKLKRDYEEAQLRASPYRQSISTFVPPKRDGAYQKIVLV